MNTCPVCGYDKMEYPAARPDTICACCGTQFGYDDCTRSHGALRAGWIKKGCPWFDDSAGRPPAWSMGAAQEQMRRAGLLPAVAAVA